MRLYHVHEYMFLAILTCAVCEYQVLLLKYIVHPTLDIQVRS